MQQRVTATKPPAFEHHTLLTTGEHDTRGISPLHVTVIRVLAAVIGVDPVETHMNLADYVCIQSLDSVCQRESRGSDEHSSVGFVYNEFDQELLVMCHSHGAIYLYDYYGEESGKRPEI